MKGTYAVEAINSREMPTIYLADDLFDFARLI